MFKWVTKKFNKLKQQQKTTENKLTETIVEDKQISKNLMANKQIFKQIFDRCGEIWFREFELGTNPPIKMMAFGLDGMLLTDQVNENVLKPLMTIEGMINELKPNNVMDMVKNKLIPVGEIKTSRQVSKISDGVLAADLALLIDGCDNAILLGVKGYEKRAMSEPETEPTVRGPRDGFIENILTNVTTVRKRIRSSRLKTEYLEVGLLSKTEVAIVYIEGIADNKVVQEVKDRIRRIDTDMILESGNIEEFIKDDWVSPFPQILSTERPDRVSAHLVEGHVAVFVDNTPFVLIMPVTFFHFLQSSEDYYSGFAIGTAIRLLRSFAVIIALLGPSLYIAITTFHQAMIPTTLLFSIAKAREGVPFPAMLEAFIMEVTFELLREAGVRLPRQVGQAVSIVGALVIGDAAVSAGLVSSSMVIVVAITAISSFAMPSYPGAIVLRLLRFVFMFLAGTLGLFGITLGLMGLFIHLCSLRSFGVPYISPIMPLTLKDWKDFIIRLPIWAMNTRPRLIGYKDYKRMGYDQAPQRPKQRETRGED